MHPQLVSNFVERIRIRSAQGDCPTEPPLSVEMLEDIVLSLAARTSPIGGWEPIATVPSLDRVLVAGWQPRSGTTQGYWWKYEDYTDESGKPMEHPNATMWMAWPASPAQPGGEK
jgi:hypothetical protein